MIELDLVQGTDEWKKVRLQNFTASEAPAMMNCSKYMSRNELLKLKKTGVEKPIDDFTQKLFDMGHKYEAMARPIIESQTDEDLKAITGLLEDTNYLASFDGLSILGDLVFEHKSWNETLAENVRNKVLEPAYYWQLEHQLMVSGAEQAIFVVSNGTEEKMLSMYYESILERREELIAGWMQFESDLNEFEVKAIEEPVIPADVDDFPLIKYQVKETQIYSNITELLSFVQTKAQIELTRELETDQDFADKDVLNKATKTARADLKNVVKSIQNEFVSYSEFATVAADIDKVLQKMQSHGEKQVKEAKQVKKDRITLSALAKISHQIEDVNSIIEPIQLRALMDLDPDFEAPMKNKRTIESLQNAADNVVAQFKIESNQIANKVKENLLTMRELASEHKFLFSDTNQLVTKDNEDLIAVIKTRIADHEKAEEARLEKEREEMRIEEEAKAQRKVDKENAEKKAREEAEEAGRIAKEAAEKREQESRDKHQALKNKELEIKESMKEVETTQPEQDIPFIDGDESAPYEVPCETDHPETKEDILQQAFSHWWDGQLTIGKDPVLMDAFKAGAAWSNLIK